MTKVVYLGEHGGSKTTTQFGYVFEEGLAVEVSDEKHLAKFRGNAHFAIDGGDGRDHQKTPETGLKAVHNGGGRFVIKRDGETIKEGLNKADADAFNALSDEDKAAYVE